MIKYIISLALKHAHIYRVSMQFSPNKLHTTLKLPTWIPGSYMIREFSKNIINIKATQNKDMLACVQVNKNTWEISGYKLRKPVEVEYEVYALDFGIRTAYLDNHRGYFNPTSLCLYALEYEHLAHSIQFSEIPGTWNIACGLNYTNGQYLAFNYEELIDNPFEVGEFTRLSFQVKGAEHFIILSGTMPPNFDNKRLLSDMCRICETQIDLFGGTTPFNSYTFLLYLGGEIYTGLEHRNSTALMAPYYSLPTLQTQQISDEYLKLLGLISHEYFHLWNVKRIKPQVFNPYNLEEETYTTLLWWFEGITSYYDDLILYRSALINKKRYLQMVLENINNVYKYSGVTQQSLVNSSQTAWIKYYRQDENSPNSVVSYYIKGALVGMCLDMIIRKDSRKKSLDDVLLGLYNKWLQDGQGIEANEMPRLVEKLTGCELDAEIYDFTATTKMLPLKELYNYYGLELIAVPGGYANVGQVLDKSESIPQHPQLNLGIKITKESYGYRINHIYSDSPAALAGLATNDLLIAMDDVRLTDLDKQLGLYKAHDRIKVTFFRQERLLTATIKPEPGLTDIYYLRILNEKKLAKWL